MLICSLVINWRRNIKKNIINRALEKMNTQYHWMVCVRCITYNHAPYITEALDGFALQQTSFPFVCCIIDDASTDGEQEIIKGYLENNFDQDDINTCRYEETEDYYLTFAHHKTNLNCYFAVLYLKYNHYSKPGCNQRKLKYIAEWNKTAKYYALCEGDDYWIDSNKLQKQVDFLENNNDYTLCFSNAVLLNPNNLPCPFDAGHIEDREYLPDEVFKTWCIPTASVLYRKEIQEVQVIKPERIMFDDIILILKAAKIGKVRGMSDIMTVYRLNNGSATQNPQYEYKHTMKRPEFVEFIIDNFGDILDLKYLYKGLCLRYCYRSLVQSTSERKYNDLIKAANINKVITLKFVLRNFVFMGIRAMFKIILRR